MGATTDTGESAPEMELDADAEIAEGIDEPQGTEIEDEMADEALAGADESVAEDEVQVQPQPQQFPINELAEALSRSIQPLVPKPPPEKKWWDDPKMMRAEMLANPEKFHKGIHELTDHKVSQAMEPVQKSIGQMFQIIQHLMHRSAERPEFASASTRAAQISKQYNIDYNVALRMAIDEAKKSPAAAGKPAQSGKKVRIPPGHASAPDTRQSAARVERDSGPADFRSIVAGLRKTGKA